MFQGETFAVLSCAKVQEGSMQVSIYIYLYAQIVIYLGRPVRHGGQKQSLSENVDRQCILCSQKKDMLS